MKYYALATNKDQQNLVIKNLSDSRILAEQEAIKYCKKRNLTYEGLYYVQPAEKWGSTMTKNAQNRKLKRRLASQRKK